MDSLMMYEFGFGWGFGRGEGERGEARVRERERREARKGAWRCIGSGVREGACVLDICVWMGCVGV